MSTYHNIYSETYSAVHPVHWGHEFLLAKHAAEQKFPLGDEIEPLVLTTKVYV